MKMISWITDDCFVDVDLPIIAELSKDYTIYWQVIFFLNDGKELQYYIKSILSNFKNVQVSYIVVNHKPWALRVIPVYISIIKNAKMYNPDYYYVSCYAAPYGALLYKLLLPLKKTVAVCHNVSTPKGANQEAYAKFYTHIWLSTFKNIQVFSQNQKNILSAKYRGKNVLKAPLAIKDYGDPKIKNIREDQKNITFLFFGIIAEYKRVDLLINAACLLYEQGTRNFKVIIAGKCNVWIEKYKPLIKYPKLFDLRIERIANEDVADLFAASDYFVMPYQDIAQSGAITVAFRYRLPVIASDIPQFKEFLNSGEDSLSFKCGDYEALALQMKVVIDGGEDLKNSFVRNQMNYVERYFSISTISKKYKQFLETL